MNFELVAFTVSSDREIQIQREIFRENPIRGGNRGYGEQNKQVSKVKIFFQRISIGHILITKRLLESGWRTSK